MVVIRHRVAKRNKQQSEISSFVKHIIISAKMCVHCPDSGIEWSGWQQQSLVLRFVYGHRVLICRPPHLIESHFYFRLKCANCE